MVNLKQMFTGGGDSKNPLGEVKSLLAELTKGKVHKKAELDVTSATLTKELKEAKLGVDARIKRENLRATPQQKEILANIMRKVENDFIEIDLKRDLGIKDPKKLEEYRMLFREYFTSKMSNEMMLEIAQSQEWEKLNLHVNEVSKYTKLDKIIATCKIEGNSSAWKAFAEKHPMLATAGSWLIGWYVGNKKEKDMTSFDKRLAKVANILGGGEETPDPNAPPPPETTPAGKPKPEVKLADLDVNQKATIKPLTDAGFVIDLDTVEADIKYLHEQHLNDQEILEITTTATKSDSNFYRMGKAITKKLAGKSVKFRLSDVYAANRLSEGQVAMALKAIEQAEASKTKIKEALNRIKLIQKDDSPETVARHLQIDPDVQTADASPETQKKMG